jgi:uncharacterized membrane protein required for colicin V production
MKALTELSFSWVDLTVVVFLLVGLFRGRKRGMTGEMLDLVKWLLILFGGALLYEPLTHYLSQVVPGLSALGGYLLSYIGFGLLMVLIFGSIKHNLGDKIAQGELFGGAEYYLGMLAGIARWGCISLVCMALIHSREYTPVEIKAREKQQEDNFGSIRFFRLYSLQADIFKSSMIGQVVEKQIPSLLIKPTSPGLAPSVQSRTPPKQRRLNEVLDH